MTQKTIITIRNNAKRIFAQDGYEGLSMRTLASEGGVGLSSIYHFFTDKDVLLKDIFDRTNTELGLERKKLRDRQTAEQMLRDRIEFQFKHMEDIVFVLKYYLHYRQNYMDLPGKILPPKAYLHIEEVLHRGISTGEFTIPNSQIETQAKIITHSINGFLLEYYPLIPVAAERKVLVSELTAFVVRACQYKEAPM
jgi:AcrR family transcriptional regulator